MAILAFKVLIFEHKRGSVWISPCVIHFINVKRIFYIAILFKMRDGLKVMPIWLSLFSHLLLSV